MFNTKKTLLEKISIAFHNKKTSIEHRTAELERAIENIKPYVNHDIVVWSTGNRYVEMLLLNKECEFKSDPHPNGQTLTACFVAENYPWITYDTVLKAVLRSLK